MVLEFVLFAADAACCHFNRRIPPSPPSVPKLPLRPAASVSIGDNFDPPVMEAGGNNTSSAQPDPSNPSIHQKTVGLEKNPSTLRSASSNGGL